MDFYTGKPDRPIEHYGIISHAFQTSQATGITKVLDDFLKNMAIIVQQSDDEALQTIEQLILEKQSSANVVYDMQVSITHVPAQSNYCIITKIYVSYGRYKD